MQMKYMIHFNLNCRDFEVSLDFYTRILGARIADRSEKQSSEFCATQGYRGNHAHRAAFLYFGDNARGPYIDLIEWAEPGAGSPLELKDTGIPRIAIAVDDVRQAHAELTAEGVDVLGPPVELQVGRSRIRAFYFRDPDGVLIEFAQRLPATD